MSKKSQISIDEETYQAMLSSPSEKAEIKEHCVAAIMELHEVMEGAIKLVEKHMGTLCSLGISQEEIASLLQPILKPCKDKAH